MKRLILASLLFAGIAFAVSATKFYCDINMQNHKVTNLAAPTAVADAVNKAYTDTADALKLPYSGGTMSGTITMGSSYSPNAGKDVATKEYVDGKSITPVKYDVFEFSKGGTAARSFTCSPTGCLINAQLLVDNVNISGQSSPILNVECNNSNATVSIKRVGAIRYAGQTFGVWFQSNGGYQEYTSVSVKDGGSGVGHFLLHHGSTNPDFHCWVKGYNTGSAFPTQRIQTGQSIDASACYNTEGNCVIAFIGISNVTSLAISGASFSATAQYMKGTGYHAVNYPETHEHINVTAKRCVYNAISIDNYSSVKDKGAKIDITISCPVPGTPGIEKSFGSLYVYPITE